MGWAVPRNHPPWAGFNETHRMIEALLERGSLCSATQPNRMIEWKSSKVLHNNRKSKVSGKLNKKMAPQYTLPKNEATCLPGETRFGRLH
jgi:hypothetical protein